MFQETTTDAADAIMQLMTYYEATWITGRSLKTWSCLNMHIRTNNDCEGYDRRLNAR